MSNPAQPPPVPSSHAGEPDDRSRLRKIAGAHRQANYAVLLYLCLAPVNATLAVIGENEQWANIALLASILVVFAFGAVSVYKLAAIFRGKGVAVIHALGLFVPLLGLLLLVVNSQQATAILQEHGIKVGLLGANPDSI